MEDDDFSLSLPDQFISQIDCQDDETTETGSFCSSSLFSGYTGTQSSQTSTICNWDSSQTIGSPGRSSGYVSTPRPEYKPSPLTFDFSQEIPNNGVPAFGAPVEDPSEDGRRHQSLHGTQKSISLLEDDLNEENNSLENVLEKSFGNHESSPFFKNDSQLSGKEVKSSLLSDRYPGVLGSLTTLKQLQSSLGQAPVLDVEPLNIIDFGETSLDMDQTSTSGQDTSDRVEDDFKEMQCDRPSCEDEGSNMSYNDEDWGEVKSYGHGEEVEKKGKEYLDASVQWDVDWAYEDIDSVKAKEIILERIEAIFSKMCTDILHRRYPLLSMLRRDTYGNLVEHTINFHNRNCRYKFAVVIKVLRKIYNLMKADAIITRRDLYYEHVNFFKDQGVAEAGITDAAMVLRVNPIYLPFQSSTKGFIAAGEGVYLKTFNDMNMEKNVHLTPEGGSMPQMSTVLGWKRVHSNAKFILVVEKDTVFTRLCHDGVFDYLDHPCIMITGKGYPDKATLAVACKLTSDLQIPVFALVDADPFGFEIAATYRWGSAMTSKIPGYNAQITVPGLVLLGVMPSEIDKYCIPQSCKIPLSDMDKRKLDTLIPRLLMEGAAAWGSELQKLKENEYKTETEALNVLSPKFLSRIYLPTKIKECLRQIEASVSYSQQLAPTWDAEFNTLYPSFGTK